MINVSEHADGDGDGDTLKLSPELECHADLYKCQSVRYFFEAFDLMRRICSGMIQALAK